VEISNRFVFLIADLPMVRSYQVGTVDLVAVLIGLSVVSFVASARWRGMLLGGTGLVLLVIHLWPVQDSVGHLRCTFLSVGQAEATLLQFPDRSTMLIDGGGYLRDTGVDFGERHLVPALHALGIKRIDRLVLTHPHPDHLGGLPAVAEQFPVGEFWQGPWEVAPGGDAARLQTILIKRGTSIRRFQSGTWQVPVGGCKMTIYTPSLYEMPHDWYGEDGNESSLVLQLTFDRFSALFMADAGLKTEQRLFGQGLSPVTLLKVGHHGSRSATGERFVRHIRHQLALISAGAGNRFGLPAPETLARLRRHGVQVYRTDHDGTVLVDTDGKDYRVTTGLGSR
jgi:competence protein ComEC